MDVDDKKRESGHSLTAPDDSPYDSDVEKARDATSPAPANADHQRAPQPQPHQQTPQQQQQQEKEDPNLVVLEGPADPLNPQNIPVRTKWIYAALLGAITFVVTFASSVFSTATAVTSKEFGVSEEVMTLGTSLFVFGFAAGPIIAGPSSELFGRKLPLFIGYFCFIIFQIGVGVAQNVETIMLMRFFSGVASAGPPAIIGGYLADFFPPVERGLALGVFAATTQVGPLLGPIIGGFVTESYLGWRWTAWLTMIMGTLFGGITVLTVPETFVPRLLTLKARKLRHETKNWALHSKQEETPVDLKAFVVKYLTRPFTMLFSEVILLLMTLYLSFVYGFLYLLFSAYPISFIQQRGYSEGVGALPFVAIFVGILAAAVYIARFTLTTVKQNFEKNGHITPEDRLPPCIWGGVCLVIGCFWFAWTSFPSINPWPQILSGIPIGAGIYLIFLQILTYLIDVYTMNANSALSANTIVRSLLGGAFPLFAMPMYGNLGTQWATSLLGFLALAFLPAPILFYKYGARLRKMSKWSQTL